MRLTELAQIWLKDVLHEGDTVIDATLGNGFDALFLAQHIGENGVLYGFDVQQKAISQSKKALSKQTCRKILLLQSHANMASCLPSHLQARVSVIMFNLGWLPGSDKNIITCTKSTISALEQSLIYLADGGRMSVMVYPGHHGGDNEAFHVIQWLENACQQSPQTLHFEKIEVALRPKAPLLLKISKTCL